MTNPQLSATQFSGFDHWSPDMTRSPWETWASLRESCPVAHSDAYGGFYVISRYADVYKAILDFGVYSSGTEEGVGVPPQEVRPLLPVDSDPPIQLAYRAIINPYLAPRAVAIYEPWIRERARDLISRFPVGIPFDVAEMFTLKFPRHVAFRVLGFPVEDMEEISGYIETLATHTGAVAEAGAGAALFGRLDETIQQARDDPDRDDIVGGIVRGTVEGRPLTEAEIRSMLSLLLFGGLGTTSASIAGMLLWLADHEKDRERLRSDPSLITVALDEFVRWASPVAHMGRTVTSTTELGGCPLKPGDRVLLSYGSANRDAAQFERADEVLLERHPNRHVGFGMGPHRCVGSHLAKLQMRVALEEFLSSFSKFEIVDHDGIEWAPGETRYISRLPFLVEKR